MYKALKFVQGSVAKKEMVAGLTHFRIENGKVKGFNGTIALCSPIDLALDCAPLAEPLVKAISNCDDTMQLTLLASGKLSVKSGKFRVNIPCTDKETPHVEPEGDIYEIDGEALIKGLATVAPFVGTDASRPWATGVLIDKGSMFATNNVIIVEYWFGNVFPAKCNIPVAAIKEMVRIKEFPTHAQVSEKSITFHYTSGRWIRAQTLALSWPDVRKIMDIENTPQSIDPAVFEGLDVVKPFADKAAVVFIENGVMRTHFDDAEGATFIINDLGMVGKYGIDKLELLKGIATSADFTKYPAPCPFFGDNLRGVIIGQRI